MIEIQDEVLVPCSPAELAPLVDDLGAYPRWMSLVHRAEPLGGDPAAWSVELRARARTAARSKRLRMERTVHEPSAHARFERRELDGRRHGTWVLARDTWRSGDATRLVMDLQLRRRLVDSRACWSGRCTRRSNVAKRGWSSSSAGPRAEPPVRAAFEREVDPEATR